MKRATLTGLTSCRFNLNPRRNGFLKRQALIFDKIGIVELDRLIRIHAAETPYSEQWYSADLEWLASKGVIYEPTVPLPGTLPTSETFEKFGRVKVGDEKEGELVKQAFKDLVDMQRECAFLQQGLIDSSKQSQVFPSLQDRAEKHFTAAKMASNYELRFALQWLGLVNNERVVLAHSLPDYKVEDLPGARKSIVWEVLFNQLPVIEANTPWERILDFRDDPDARHSIIELNQWVNTIATTNKSANDIEDEFTYLRMQYENALKLHRLEFRAGVLETVIQPLFEIAENLVKIKWSKLPEPILRLRKQKIALQKAEASAPGRQLSYFTTLENKFGREK